MKQLLESTDLILPIFVGYKNIHFYVLNRR